ncbi:DUF6538 domain-containing protein [uncultured Methylobacterium sp.]|uniref:DUF6538 domain-containing protein n=1 Tax=uncultured Methylobacterium sp. TaxID=157278 RepID=UPI002620F06E|nr:DUF6538 domain-containing protein [uncultured Methylobacterium sp.]
MSRLSYVVRLPSGVYYFRRAIPPALRSFMPDPWRGKTAWKESLRTSDYPAAKKAHARVWQRCSADFDTAERAKRGEPVRPSEAPPSLPPDADIQDAVLAELLTADEAERAVGDARRQLQDTAERAQWPDLVSLPRRGMAEDHYHVYGIELEEELRLYRVALSRADPRPVDAECRAFLREHRILIGSTSDTYHEAGMLILKATVRAFDDAGAQAGEVVDTPAPPAAGTAAKLTVNAKAREERQPFTSADLAAIFGTGVYRNGDRPAGGEAAYWLPVLALLTEARQGELAQLQVGHAVRDPESGVWHLHIGTSGAGVAAMAGRRGGWRGTPERSVG